MSQENENTGGDARRDADDRNAPAKVPHVVQVDQEFAAFDRDGDGSIDYDEFSRLVTHLGLGRGKTITRGMFDAIDTDASGRITASEFSAWWAKGE